MLFQFVSQTGRSYMESFNPPGFDSNQPREILSRWRNPGDIATIQKFTQTVGPASTAYSLTAFSGDNQAVVDASFVRLKNISLSWTLPKRVIEKAGLENTRIYFQAQNLFTVTNYGGLDPETQTVNSLPPLRMLTLGVQLTF